MTCAFDFSEIGDFRHTHRAAFKGAGRTLAWKKQGRPPKDSGGPLTKLKGPQKELVGPRRELGGPRRKLGGPWRAQ